MDVEAIFKQYETLDIGVGATEAGIAEKIQKIADQLEYTDEQVKANTEIFYTKLIQ